MRGILRDRLYNKHYNKLISSRSGKTKKQSINTFSSVTILAPVKYHKVDDLLKAHKYFSKLNVACDIYALEEKAETMDMTANVTIIKREECEWYGVPSQEILIQWLANKTDLLIMSNPDSLPLMRYLCAASNCKLKSSMVYEGQETSDLDIDLWVDVDNAKSIPLDKQCDLTYSTLTKLGIRPPVIGS